MTTPAPDATPTDGSAPEGTAPYGNGPAAAAAPPKRVRIPHLQAMKERGERWAMLTAYDMYAAQVFDGAGIPVLLVGDSAGNNVYGYETTLPITLDEMIPLVRAVAGAAKHALVVADLPFGSYEASREQAFMSAVRVLKETGAGAVKLEGGARMAETVRFLVERGVPFWGACGITLVAMVLIGMLMTPAVLRLAEGG